MHSLPPPTFSSVDAAPAAAVEAGAAPAPNSSGDRVIKVVFDQYGGIYPDASTPGPPLPPADRAKEDGFGLARYYGGLGLRYDPTAIRAQLGTVIRAAMARNNAHRVVILIRGFNNDFASFEEGFDFLRQKIEALAPGSRPVYLQVYWDAYAHGTVAAASFLSALGSSNLAGQCGLRPLLSQLPPGTDVTFVTHSRGAAVALAVATDPPVGSGRAAERCSPLPAPPSTLGDVALVAFAPAVGDGLVRKDGVVPPDLFLTFDRIYVGFDPQDPQTSKSVLGVRLGGLLGDTRLGSDAGYLAEVEAGSAGRISHESFDQRDHALGAYFAQERQSRCLLWAGRLTETQPEGCMVKR